jgi:hypothetical protein
MQDPENNVTETEESSATPGLAGRLLHRAKQAFQTQLAESQGKVNAEAAILAERENALAKAASLLTHLAAGRKDFSDRMEALEQQASDAEGAKIETQLADEYVGIGYCTDPTLAALFGWQTLRALRPLIQKRARLHLIENREVEYAGIVAKQRDAMKAAGFPLKA